MSENVFAEIIAGLKDGSVVPYLGAGALKGSVHKENGSPIPADSDSLILAMNNGQPMAPKLMYEFPRAAMNQELKKGRTFLTRFLNETYGGEQWTRAPLHDWLAEIRPAYVVDINRDTQLQATYADTPHNLIVGVARIAGTDYRFRIYHWDGTAYNEIEQEAADPALPVLFKPMGTPNPEANFIASDADYVDYITELMGGFAIPSWVKKMRIDKRYLFIGTRMTRDTERMVLSDIIYGSDIKRGWALLPDATEKEKRFCAKMGIEVIDADVAELIGEERFESEAAAVGC
jgi:hypothetical protein